MVSLFANAIAAVGLVLALSPLAEVSAERWTWAATLVGVQAVRWIELRAFQRAPENLDLTVVWMWLFAAGVLVTALLWASFPLLFGPELDVVGRTSMLVVNSAMAGGAVGVLSASRWLAVAFLALMLLPTTWLLLSSGGRADVTLGVLTLAFGSALSLIVRNTHRNIVASLRLGRANEHLMQRALEQAEETHEHHQRAEALNTQLVSARNELQQANDRLEVKVRARTALLEREMEKRRVYQSRLESLASVDPLTGLANRDKLGRELEAAMNRARTSGGKVGVLFVDLDRFKDINDGMGHMVGDRVLRTVAQRLRDCMPDAVCVARWGGDEFVVVRHDNGSASTSWTDQGDRIVHALSQPIELSHGTVMLGASIGIAVFPEHAADADTLIGHADVAVYEAKLVGRGTACLYQPFWGERAQRRRALIQSLRQAIERDEIELHFQPIVSIPDRRIVSYEALARWTHPQLGQIPPSTFIPLAEESGNIGALGVRLLERACEAAVRLSDRGRSRVTVNVSVDQLGDGSFVAALDRVLDRTGLPPQQLEIELTETVFASNVERVQSTLNSIRERGVAISIDDFGSGYSSLAYLQRFPADTFKIDRTFVRDLDRGGDAIISAVVSIARSLGIDVVVEGVESEQEVDKVLALGVTRAQGYLFDLPRPLDELMLAAASRPRAEPGPRPLH